MGGSNPYIDEAVYQKPAKPYTLRIAHEGGVTEVQVEPEKIPYSHDGLPGSILDIALSHGVDMDHACGGVAACSTCHVHVSKGLESCNAISEAEEDQLDYATDYKEGKSRLSCQCVPNGSAGVVEVAIPSWNRNLIKEKHG